MNAALLFVTLFVSGILAVKDPYACPDDQPHVKCLIDPCEAERHLGCPLNPTAECKASGCGGCYPHWYINGRRVYCFADLFY